MFKIKFNRFYIIFLERGERIEKPNGRFGARGRGGWRGGRRNHPYQRNTQHTPEETCRPTSEVQNTPEPTQSTPQEPKPATTAVKTLNEVEVFDHN